MQVLKEMKDYGHEMIVYCRDDKVGLQAIIAVHNTVLGPALGGARFWNYQTEEEALVDVLRLSEGMTLKNAAAGLPCGGGKAVIIGDPAKLKSKEFFNSFGRFVNKLSGCYYTAEDVNTSDQDMLWIRETTPFVSGLPSIGGNPSPFTARGTYMGMKGGAKFTFGSDSLAGKTIAIQGLGNVGYGVAEYCHKEGAHLKVFDLNPARVAKAVKELGATAVGPEEIITTACDIFAPCALGAVLNTHNIGKLKAKMIAGCANNVLLDAATGFKLEELGIIYCPDYVINAGGVMNCAGEMAGHYDKNAVLKKVDNIYHSVFNILTLAKQHKLTSFEAAKKYAWDIIHKGPTTKQCA